MKKRAEHIGEERSSRAAHMAGHEAAMRVFAGDCGVLLVVCQFLDTRREVLGGLSVTCSLLRRQLGKLPLALDQRQHPALSETQLERLLHGGPRLRLAGVHVALSSSSTAAWVAARDSLVRSGGDGGASLRRLQVSRPLSCGEFALPGLGRLPNLRSLSVRWAKGLRNLAGLEGSLRLTTISLQGCDALSDLSALGACAALWRLDLSGCSALRDAGPLRHCAALRSVRLRGCLNLDNVAFAGALPRLARLEIEGSLALSSLDELAGARALACLHVRFCPNLQSVGAVAGLATLHELDFRGCPLVADADCVQSLHGLRRLIIDAGHGLNLARLDGSRLLELGVHGSAQSSALPVAATAAASLNALGPRFPALRKLALSEIGSLQSLAGLAHCTALDSLEVSACRGLVDVAAVRGMCALRSASFRRCTALAEIASLGACASLERIDLTHCTAIADLTALATLPRVKRILLGGCRSGLVERGKSAAVKAKPKAAPGFTDQAKVRPRRRSVGRRRDLSITTDSR